MTTKHLGRLFLMSAAVLAANCAWAGKISPVEPLGDNAYRITVKANSKFTRNTEKLKAQATEAATQFCAKEGRLLKVVSVEEDKNLYLVGAFAQVTLTFKALSSGDPELAAPAAAQGKLDAPAAAQSRSDAPATAPGKPAVTTSDSNEALYADLLRLDDLHKKGILTDAEFDAEKKKVLARSK